MDSDDEVSLSALPAPGSLDHGRADCALDVGQAATSFRAQQVPVLSWLGLSVSVPLHGRFRRCLSWVLGGDSGRKKRRCFSQDSDAGSSEAEDLSRFKPLLTSIDGAVSAGEILYIMGASGAGKSMLLDALADRLRLRNVYVPPADPWADGLDVSGEWTTGQLTVEGELNKLAANISIGRNMAGVHFYTDYYDSLRMGERVAAGILQEQMATYNDPCSMRLPSFDGDRVVISTTGRGDARLEVLGGDAGEWWSRHLPGAAFA